MRCACVRASVRACGARVCVYMCACVRYQYVVHLFLHIKIDTDVDK